MSKERLENDENFYQMDNKEKLNAAEEFIGILIKRHVDEGEYHPDQMNALAWLIEQAEQLHGRKGHYGYKEMYGKCNCDYAELKSNNNELKNQNKHYREQLELIREDTFATEEDEVYVSIKHLIRKRVDKAMGRDCIHCNGKGFNGLDYCSQCNQRESESE